MALIASMEVIDFFIKKWEDKVNKQTSLLDFTKVENVDAAISGLNKWLDKIKEVEEDKNKYYWFWYGKNKKMALDYEAGVLAEKLGYNKLYFSALDELSTQHQIKGLEEIKKNLLEKERLEKEMLDKAYAAAAVNLNFGSLLKESASIAEETAKTFMEGFTDYIRLHSEGYSEAIARLVAGIHPEFPRMLGKDEEVKGYPSPKVLKTMTPKQLKDFGTSPETNAKFRNIPLDVSNLPPKDVPTGRMVIQAQIEVQDEEIKKLEGEKVEIQIKLFKKENILLHLI